MSLKDRYKMLFNDKNFRKSVIVGLISLVFAGFVVGQVQKYINQAPGNPVGDLILDNLPPFPWPELLVNTLIWGSILTAFSILLITLSKPEYLPASLKTIALLYFVRAFFISLTHLKVHAGKIIPDQADTLTQLLYGSNDLFFSGHVALPFVASLIFWKIKPIRYYLLIATLFFAIGTLWAKSHYSIDVFAVPFMGYTIFVIARRLFKKDFKNLDTLD